MGFRNVSVRTWGAVKRHGPAILTGLGICGMGAGIVLAVKATPEAQKKIEEKKKELGRDLTKWEKVKASWKCYVPTALCGLGAAGCVVGANVQQNKRQAALMAAYEIAQKGLKEYKEATKEVAGEKVAKQIQGNLGKKRLEENPPTQEMIDKPNMSATYAGLHQCLDLMYGQGPFLSNEQLLEKGVNEINKRLNAYGYASLNELYCIWGIPMTKLGNQIGWNRDYGLIELVYDSQLYKGTPCLTFDYNIYPTYGFDRA